MANNETAHELILQILKTRMTFRPVSYTHLDVYKRQLTKPVDSIKPLIFKKEDEGAELRMNFLLDITPDADIELIMDCLLYTS